MQTYDLPAVDALTWKGIQIGGASSPVHFDDGIEGLGGAPIRMPQTERTHGDGAWGGLATEGIRQVAATAWFDADHDDHADRDFRYFHRLEAAMDRIPGPFDEQPLMWAGLTDEVDVAYGLFVRPARCEWMTDEDAVEDGAPGIDLAWTPSDSSIWRLNPQHEVFGYVGEDAVPVNEHSWDVVNAGYRLARGPRSMELRLTAHGTVRNPFIRVEHLDGSVEQVTWLAELTGGQVLKVDEWRRSTIAGRLHGRIWSLNESGVASPASRWPEFLPEPVEGVVTPHVNLVTVGAESGVFTGFLDTRSTR